MTNWGVQVREYGIDSYSKCWRCLQEAVPDEDELGLCKLCIALLRDSSDQRFDSRAS
jgi:hypothetical protein